MAALGVYVSLKPRPAEKHIRYIVAFIFLFLCGGIVNVVQARLASKAEEELKGQLNKIQKNTEQPPIVNVTVPSPVLTLPVEKHNLTGFLQVYSIVPVNKEALIGKSLPLSFNLFFQNMGTEPVHAAHSRWSAVIPDGIPSEDQEKKVILKFFRDQTRKAYRQELKEGKQGPRLGVKDQQWATLTVPALSESNAQGLLNGTRRLYIYGSANWIDAEGNHGDTEVCQWLQQPTSNPLKAEELVWHSCVM